MNAIDRIVAGALELYREGEQKPALRAVARRADTSASYIIQALGGRPQLVSLVAIECFRPRFIAVAEDAKREPDAFAAIKATSRRLIEIQVEWSELVRDELSEAYYWSLATEQSNRSINRPIIDALLGHGMSLGGIECYFGLWRETVRKFALGVFGSWQDSDMARREAIEAALAWVEPHTRIIVRGDLAETTLAPGKPTGDAQGAKADS